MTLREKILQIIGSALTADETSMSPVELDEITDIILEAEELSAEAANVFSEDGATFVSQVSTLFGRLPLAIPRERVFPRASNLVTCLQLANELDPDELEAEVPDGLAAFAVREAPLDAFKKSGTSLNLFFYEHPFDLGQSVAFMDLRGAPLGGSEVENIPHRMAACVSILVGEEEEDLAEKAWVISTVEDEERRISHCKYHLLLAGYLLTNPVFAPSTAALQGIAEILRVTEEYNQFSEPFEMLGEINSRTTVLDTFLSCYHVLENYMIRAQIAKVVERSNAAALFSIRNFKQMEIAVQSRELFHLDSLIKASWNKHIGGDTFRDFVEARLQELFNHSSFVADQFHRFMERLTVKNSGQQLDLNSMNDATALLPKLLYQVRCSIVHNKETEFHLSNRELNIPTVLLTLTTLCLPVMQRLAFGLPSVGAPNPLRYATPALRLY